MAQVSPKVFISYSHDSDAHRDAVLAFANHLRHDGIDAMIDQFSPWPEEGWPRWMEKQIRQSDFVLMVCTETYLKRVEDREEPTRGFGVLWESNIIYSLLYNSRTHNKKFIPILFDHENHQHVPAPLQGYTSYHVHTETEYDGLYRQLTNQPAVTAGKLGKLKTLPILTRHEAFATPKCLHNLPYGSIGTLFKGREKDFKWLHEHVMRQTTAITQPAAMYGLGGIGKTRLAVEFAYKAMEEGAFDSVFFVRCGTTDRELQTTPQKELAALGRLHAAVNVLAGPDLLAIEGAMEQPPEVVFAKVMAVLNARKNWLLIFDNVDDMEMRKVLLGLLPRLVGGRVLVTSRLTDWGLAVKPLPIETLGIEDSAAYLLDSTEDMRIKTKDEAASAQTLAQRLDGLPVALEQATAYIRREKMSLAAYLIELEQNIQQLLDNPELAILADAYGRTISATWQMTVQKLGVCEKTLLQLIAFLGSDMIPVCLFEDKPEIIGEGVAGLDQYCKTAFDKKEVHRAILSLANWSMIEFEGATFSVHRLVQETTRLRMSVEEQKSICTILLSLLVSSESKFAAHDVRSWGYWKGMEPHVAAATRYADGLQITDFVSTLMNELGLFDYAQARYPQAEPLMKRALAIDEASLGKDHPKVAIRLNNLAQLCKTTNRLSEAKPLMKRALAIDEANLGKDHPSVAIKLNNLAQLYKLMNRLSEAEPLYKRALVIDEASLGKDHPRVATDLNNLAQLYKATNRLSEAEPLYKRALAIDEASFGKDHPEVATDLNNLAQLYKATNRLSEAEPLMKRHLWIFIEFGRKTGHPHPHLDAAINNYASLLMAMGNGKAEVMAKLKAMGIER